MNQLLGIPATLLASLSLTCAIFPAHAQKAPIQITADLSDAPRKLYHAEIDLPVAAGPLTLTTPQWIPGHHRPIGPVDEITGVFFTANGQPIPWRRDDVDLYQFHLVVPNGVSTIHAHLDCIVTQRVSQKLAVLEWEKLLLYPANTPVRDIPIQASLIVPAGWGIGTALTPIGAGAFPIPAAGAITHFAATSVEQLEDSPIITGRRSRRSTSSTRFRTTLKIQICAPLCLPNLTTWYAKPMPFTAHITTTPTTFC
jgi:predicted metalloprotease with PDZ domain